jgi:hypothetical protein
MKSNPLNKKRCSQLDLINAESNVHRKEKSFKLPTNMNIETFQISH